jgi:uncharacterized protein (DUF302 family)
MDDFGRRIVVDLPFEAALGETCRALRAEGFAIIGRIDVREHFWRDLGHDFRQYFLLDAWAPEPSVNALAHELDAGTLLPTRVAVYELPDGETAIVIAPPLWPLRRDYGWSAETQELATLADVETARVARVLEHLQQAGGPARAAA